MASPGQPRRELVYACIHPETYKYFFERDAALRVWDALAREFGPVRYDQNVRIMEIRTSELIVRSTMNANPITVIRTRHCSAAAIRRLHATMGYPEDEAREPDASG